MFTWRGGYGGRRRGGRVGKFGRAPRRSLLGERVVVVKDVVADVDDSLPNGVRESVPSSPAVPGGRVG